MARQQGTEYADVVQKLSSIIPASIVDGLLHASTTGSHPTPSLPNGDGSRNPWRTQVRSQKPYQRRQVQAFSSRQQPLALHASPVGYTGPFATPHVHPQQISHFAAFPPGQHLKTIGDPAHAAGQRHARSMGRGDMFADEPQSGKRSGAPGPRKRSPGKVAQPAPSAIRALLKHLQSVAQERIVKFRKVNHLGPGGLAAIRAHCEAHGGVDDVLALQPPPQLRRVRPSTLAFVVPQVRRVRTSTLAFVVMADAEAAVSVLAAGHKQYVEGQGLVVEAYEHRHSNGSDGGDGAAASQSVSAPQRAASALQRAASATKCAAAAIALSATGVLDDDIISLSSEESVGETIISMSASATGVLSQNGSLAARTNTGRLLDDDIISLSSEEGESRFADMEFWPTDDEFD